MSIILAVLGIDSSITFFNDKMNLYHSGDKVPFANILIKNGIAHLVVNSNECLGLATNLNMGKYVKRN